jgi:hypothetical protein
MSRAMWFRVGIDKGTGGCLAPIFEDNSFVYMPIPDINTTEKCTYKTCKGIKNGKPFREYVKKKNLERKLNYDPDFRGKPVYGDSTSHRKKISCLKKDELLAFYAGLTRWKEGKKPCGIDCYWIGYIIVEKSIVTNIDNIFDQPPNAHKKRFDYFYSIADSINSKYSVDLDKIVELIRDKRIDEKDAYKGLEILSRYRKIENKVDNYLHFTWIDFWREFLDSSSKDIIINTYLYLLEHLTKYTLIVGTEESDLLSKAIQISKSGTDRENKITGKWSSVLGYPEGKSIKRKNPRWVPNPNYGNKGDPEKLREILLKANEK